MYYKILEEKTSIESDINFQEERNMNKIKHLQNEIINELMRSNDSKVNVIHENQEKIKENLHTLYKQNDSFLKLTKEANKVYDEFVEYLKEAGDLFNYSEILSKNMNSLHDKIVLK